MSGTERKTKGVMYLDVAEDPDQSETPQSVSKRCLAIYIVLLLKMYILCVVVVSCFMVDPDITNTLLTHGTSGNISSETQSIGLSAINLNDTNSTEQQKHREDNKSYPTYLVILKSPRSGSSYLFKGLNENPLIFQKFEPRMVEARKHFRECSHFQPKTGDNEEKRWTCTVSLNDYLQSRTRFDEINDLIREYSASVVIQLRANVVEKGISAAKLWGVLKPGKHPTDDQIAWSIVNSGLKSIRTIRGHVIADKFMHSVEPSIWVWYEDLVRNCSHQFERIYEAIGLPFVLPQKCSEAKFIGAEPYEGYLVNALKKEPSLEPMINHLTFNQEVDTDAIYRKMANETANVTEPSFGHWRRLIEGAY